MELALYKWQNCFVKVVKVEDIHNLYIMRNPQVAKNLIYDYKGLKIKAFRNEAGWNSVYVAGKIIKKIGPILAIKNKDFNYQYVAEKTN